MPDSLPTIENDFSFAEVVPTMLGLAEEVRLSLHEREDDFLALGGSFMEFTLQSQALSAKAGELAELTAGNDIEQGISDLSSELEAMTGVCQVGAGEMSLKELEGLMGVIRDLEQNVGEFGRVVRSLQMLGISTRIESARLGSKGAGFSTLADDVEKLAHKIVANSSAIRENSKSLSELIESVKGQTVELIETQHACSDRIMTEIGGNVESLRNLVDRSREVSEGLTGRTASIAANISETVSSMQFHDIIRQQVEHVEEALNDVADMVRERTALPDASDQGDEAQDASSGDADSVSKTGLSEDMCDLVGWTADVASLQVHQMADASERLATAVDTLRVGIRGISDGVFQVGRDVSAILEAEAGAEGTVLDRIESSSNSVIDSLGEFSVKAGEIGSLMGGVATTVAEIVSFVDDIEDVGSEIELIALNASIKAAHTGEEGKALGVLASAIQNLSVDARGRTRRISKILLGISSSADALRENASQYMDTAQIQNMASRQKDLMEGLKQTNGRILGLFSQVQDESGDLGNRLSDLSDGITLDAEICPTLDRAHKDLADVVARARVAVPESDDKNRPERLKELLRRYTMEAERLVHATAFGEAAEQVVMDSHDDEVELFGDGGGDNEVELFGDDDDGVELFGDDDDDGVELFGDDDQVELFDGQTADSPAQDSESEKPDNEAGGELGDNIELF